MRVGVALFEQVTALDAVGPYEVLQRLPGAEVYFVGHRKGEVRTDNGFLGLTVDYTFDEVPNPEIVLVPGGFGTLDELFEALTLIQTGKVEDFPVVLMGREHWSELIEWLHAGVAEPGMLDARELELHVTDDPAEAAAIACGEADAPSR